MTFFLLLIRFIFTWIYEILPPLQKKKPVDFDDELKIR